MASAFDQYLLPTSDYIPEYQGMPLAQLEAGAKRLEDTYLRNLAAANKLDILNAERRAVDGDSEANQRVTQRYQEALDAMARSGDYENMTTRVAAAAREYARDPEVKAILESRANYDQEQAMIQKMLAAGHTPLFRGDPKSHQSYNPETGEVNIYRPQVEAMLDYEGRMAKIWGDLTPDAGIGELSEQQKKLLGDNLPYFMAYGQWKGIGDTKIARQIDNALNSYKMTQEYGQQKRKYMSENMTEAQAEAQIRKDVLDRGELKKFWQSDIAARSLPAGAFKGQTPTALGYEEMSADFIKGNPGYTADDFDKEADRVEQKEGTETSRYLGFNPAGQSTTRKGEKENISEEERKNFEAGVVAGMEIYAPGRDPSTITEKEKLEYAQKYEDLVKSRMVSWKFGITDWNREKKYGNVQGSSETTEELQKDLTANVQRYAPYRSYLDLETGKVFTPTDEGYFSQNFQKFIGDPANMEAAGTVDPKHFMGDPGSAFVDAYVVSVTDPDTKETRTLLQSRGASGRNSPEHLKAQNINNAYRKLTERPNQIVEFNVYGAPVKAKKVVYDAGNGNIQTHGIVASVAGGPERIFKDEDDMVNRLELVIMSHGR